MRIISLNVDGVVQAAEQGLFGWLEQQGADVICLQDLRASEDSLQSPLYFPDAYCAYFCDRADGERGVAIYTRQMPRAVMQGFGYSPDVDLDGTYVRADFEQFSIVSLLVPPASLDPRSLENRMRFLDQLQLHFQKISQKRRKYIFCCSWYMANQKADVQDWEASQSQPGFLPFERQWLNELYNDIGYVDAFRAISGERHAYSWWPASSSGGKVPGWRVDNQVVSPEFASYVQQARYVSEPRFSSHLALVIDYDIDLY